MNKEKLEKAKQCLIDNGIETEEAETVLQALGYILLDTELSPEETNTDTPLISRDDFAHFVADPTRTLICGNFLQRNGDSKYFTVAKRPLASKKHRVDALYGCQSYFPNSASKSTSFEFSQSLEFLALVVDGKDFFYEGYCFFCLFGDHDAQRHYVKKEMAEATAEYVSRVNPVTDEYLKTERCKESAMDEAVRRFVDRDFSNSLANMVAKATTYSPFSCDGYVVEFLADPDGWAERIMPDVDAESVDRYGHNYSIDVCRRLIAVDALAKEYCKKFEADPNGWESECKRLFPLIDKYKNIRIFLEANGEAIDFPYQADNFTRFWTVTNKTIWASGCTTRNSTREIEAFVKKNCIDFVKSDSEIPICCIKKITAGRTLLWENSFFVNSQSVK